MYPYVRALQKRLLMNTNPGNAGPMKRYMRDQFEYVGLKTPELGALLKEYYAERGFPALTDLDGILHDLWALPQREFQYTGLGLLAKFAEELPPEFIDTVEYLLVTKSWWDTVDSIAGGTLGIHFRRYPKVRKATLTTWRKCDNFWLRRSCILFQLNYKADTDFDLLCAIIRENLGSKEFFINKAIGWALRQYARTDPNAVRAFVKATPLHPLSAREALKRL